MAEWIERIKPRRARHAAHFSYPRVDHDAKDYTVERARAAVEEMRHIDIQQLWTPGTVTKLPYPGTGPPPPRPGGDIQFVGLEDLKPLAEAANEAASAGAGGRVYITGPRGAGKSCRIRALAWIIIILSESHQKLVCIWSMEFGGDFVEVFKRALRSTYCNDDGVLEEIAGLLTVPDIEAFLKSKCDEKQVFYFIVDGAEVLDSRHSADVPRDESEEKRLVKANLNALLKYTHCCIYGLSPSPEMARKRKIGTAYTMTVQEGFYGEELVAYMDKVSILGKLFSLRPDRVKDFLYYAAGHPLSINNLDSSCKKHARRRLQPGMTLGSPFGRRLQPTASSDEMLAQLLDEEDWQEVLALFQSSTYIESIRDDARKHFRRPEFKLPRDCYKLEDMAKLDMRFVLQTSAGGYEYVTPYIGRIYNEELRSFEEETRFKEGAWEPYCKFLLDHDVKVNWLEMGWLCENLVGDVLSYKGLLIDGMVLKRVRTQRFFSVPRFDLWKHELRDGSGIFFIPADSNYPLIDGVVVWRDLEGNLHFYAIQITVNDEQHQRSATDFMALNLVKEWIPEGLNNWTMHFVFICCNQKKDILVAANLKQLKGMEYGNVEYRLHTVSFQKAMEQFVDKDVIQTLTAMVSRREDAGWKARNASAPEATTTASSKAAAAPAQVTAIANILSCPEFTKAKRVMD